MTDSQEPIMYGFTDIKMQTKLLVGFKKLEYSHIGHFYADFFFLYIILELESCESPFISII